MEPMSTATMYNDQFELDPRAYGLVTDETERPTVTVPPPGFYTVQLTEADVRRRKETGEVWPDAKGQLVFRISRIEVIDPQEFAGSFRLMQDIYVAGRPQMNYSVRPPVPYTDRPPVFQIVKLLAAVDPGLVTGSLEDNCQEVQRLLPSRPTVTVKLTYESTDKAHAEALMASGIEKNAAYKQARLYPKHFRNADGSYRQSTLGPSGSEVRAYLKIEDFIPASRTTNLTLGPLKAKS